AINTVSDQRSQLGALQNRLEHTITNLDNVAENLQVAESGIRDTDMAEMMVQYSKNNIIQQAAQSMLAQANQSTQGVLSLLG
ncbi:MAG: flagellin, partial [Lachnospiraceae bacterium]|nr:flagellin [Lachnospiraceae bacterium]